MDKINKIENIVINNKKIQTQIKELDIFQINYYLENPRINYMMGKINENISQDDIEKNLWKLDSVKDLYEDIERNGGLLEEIIVMGNNVVEGNSRLCAYRHLYNNAEENEKNKWRFIRSKVILDNLESKDLFSLLGKFHIKGKTEWDAFEVASYIHKTIKEENLSIKEVAKLLGMKSTTIENKLKAYDLMSNEYLPSLPSTEEAVDHLKKFSTFEEYYKNSDLQKLVNEGSQIVDNKKFVNWVLEGRIGSAAFDVRALPKILKNKAARKVFISSDPVEAISDSKPVLLREKPEEGNYTLGKIKEMTNFLESLEIGKFKDSIKDNKRAYDIVKKFRSVVKELCNKLEINNINGESIKKLSRKRKIRIV